MVSRLSGTIRYAAGCVAASVMAFSAAGQDEAAASVDFVNDIWPIFQTSCLECHGPERQRGELRLDTPEAVLKGGAFGPVLVAGEPDKSSLYTLVILPPDHPDVMPGSGDPLSPEQQDLIKRWIAEGASFGEWAGLVVEEKAEDKLTILAKNVQPAPEEALANVRSTGALAMALDQRSPLIQVNFQLQGKDITDEHLDLLASASDQITWLNLAGTSVTNEGLAKVAPLKNLTMLYLERTGISDDGLKHLAGLEHLEYLNLYATQVSDAGLEHLTGLKNLKRLYLWQSNVTKDGADRLAAAIPALDINLGLELAMVDEPAAADEAPATESEAPKSALEAAPLAFFFDSESCCGKAAAGGEACAHPCCVEAAGKNEVCPMCNPGAEAKRTLAAKFDNESCCGRALFQGNRCDHPCCIETWDKGEVCLTCNPGAAAADAATGVPVALIVDAESCCGKALQTASACAHPCCVEAAGKNEACPKCNPGAEARLNVIAQFNAEGCCGKALAESKLCSHPCCAEAWAKTEVCTKCNPAPEKKSLSA